MTAQFLIDATEFAQIPASTFYMGADDGIYWEDGEGPCRPVELDAFRIAKSAVSNAQFKAFVDATDYVSQAETVGASLVFQGRLEQPDLHPAPLAHLPWWRWVKGACWRVPNGDTAAPPDHPAVHLSRADALAYCAWRGVSLPTEAQWECAAGDQREIDPHIWQGEFPNKPSQPPMTRSVAAAAPNNWGLMHACGNVWEWTNDRFTKLHGPNLTRNPQGPLNGQSFVVKGGSYLCAPSYCARYRPSSRRGEAAEATSCHLGFRVVMPQR